MVKVRWQLKLFGLAVIAPAHPPPDYTNSSATLSSSSSSPSFFFLPVCVCDYNRKRTRARETDKRIESLK
jgi:hypothetical protein